jgi:hypothetical protein
MLQLIQHKLGNMKFFFFFFFFQVVSYTLRAFGLSIGFEKDGSSYSLNLYKDS